MKATEARLVSVTYQYSEIKKLINEAISHGCRTCNTFTCNVLYPEVAEMLAKEGYNIQTFFFDEEDMFLYFTISWESPVDVKPQERKVTVDYGSNTGNDLISRVELFEDKDICNLIKDSVIRQYYSVQDIIKQATYCGWSCCTCKESLYQKVAEILAKEGYDVEMGSDSRISWGYALEGELQEGKVTRVE